MSDQYWSLVGSPTRLRSPTGATRTLRRRQRVPMDATAVSRRNAREPPSGLKTTLRAWRRCGSGCAVSRTASPHELATSCYVLRFRRNHVELKHHQSWLRVLGWLHLGAHLVAAVGAWF